MSFICKSNELSFKDRLLKLNLSPTGIKYWLEFLELVFFFKCRSRIVKVDLLQFVTFSLERSRQSVSSNKLSKDPIARTSRAFMNRFSTT